MIRPIFLLPSWFRILTGINILIAGLGSAPAHAGGGYKDIAYFEEGTVATFTIVVEYKADGDRSINLRFNRPPYGGSMFFHTEQWKIFADNLARVKSGPDGTEQTFADLDTPGGSLLRMSAVRHGGQVNLTLIDQPHKGDSYPPVPFHLSPPDFENLLKAMVDAAKANLIVSAASADEFAKFRADLGTRFAPEQLQDFDVAIEELKLDATNRNVTTDAGREADMLAVVNRKIFPDVVLLGWRARKARLIRGIPEAIRLVNEDTAEAAKAAASGTPADVTRRLATEKEALAKLRCDRDDAIRRVTEMAEFIGKPH
jgi:hypothetical protein